MSPYLLPKTLWFYFSSRTITFFCSKLLVRDLTDLKYNFIIQGLKRYFWNNFRFIENGKGGAEFSLYPLSSFP